MQSAAIPETISLIALESIARPPKARNQNLKHNVLYQLRRQKDSEGLIWSRMDCGVVVGDILSNEHALVGDILSMLCVSFRLLCCYSSLVYSRTGYSGKKPHKCVSPILCVALSCV